MRNARFSDCWWVVGLVTLLAMSGMVQAATVADSLDDWSVTGTQGEKNWYNGYYNRTQDVGGVYQVADFIQFSATDWKGSNYAYRPYLRGRTWVSPIPIRTG